MAKLTKTTEAVSFVPCNKLSHLSSDLHTVYQLKTLINHKKSMTNGQLDLILDKIFHSIIAVLFTLDTGTAGTALGQC